MAEDNGWCDPWVVVFDYSNYFGSIDSTLAFNKLTYLYHSLCITDEEHESVDKLLEVAKIFIEDEKVLGLGNQTSQTMAIWFINYIDHKAQQYGYYGRYMDDGYCICPDRATAEDFKTMLANESNALGLTLNPKKVHTIHLIDESMTMLKRDYLFTPDGRLHVRMNKKAVRWNHHHVGNVIRHTDGISIPIRQLINTALNFKANAGECTDNNAFIRKYYRWFEERCAAQGIHIDMSEDENFRKYGVDDRRSREEKARRHREYLERKKECIKNNNAGIAVNPPVSSTGAGTIGNASIVVHVPTC